VLDEAIARGGHSIVFRARILRDDDGAGAGRAVAIKVLKDATPSAAAVARLKREFRQTQSLRLRGVVDMFDLECDRGTWFIAMELLDGMSLRTRLNRVATQPLGRPEALQVVAECAAVLGRAHRQGFAHGDVKPGNLFLQERGGAKVLDFGAANDLQPAPPFVALEAERTSVVATRTYASPEVLDGQAVEPRDDVFSLACVAYEMLSGRHPFSRVPANEARVRAMQVTPIEGLAPRQNEALASALAWSRTSRPSSIEAWCDALLNQNPVTPAAARPQANHLTPAEWLPWRWIGAVGAVAALLLAVVWWASDDPTASAPAAIADSQPDVSQLQDEPPAVASPPSANASDTLESTLTVPSAAVLQAPIATAGATPTSPENVARPARVSTSNRLRIEADTSVRISESAPAAVVILRRSGNTAAPVTVKWHIQDGSARNDEDFTTPAGRSARLAAGQTTRAIYVPLVNDERSEPEEFFSLILQSPAEAIGESSRVTITVLDDD
jgi:serine/threonine protein kinase